MNTKKILTGALMTVLFGAGLFGAASMAYAQAASNITCNSATLEGEFTVTPVGDQVTAWFEWGTSGSLGTITAQQSFSATGQLQVFSQPISGLQPNTVYSYEAVTRSTAGTFRGGVRTFTTCTQQQTQTVTVTTNPATNVSQYYATLNGFASGNGSNANAWFEWGASQSFGSQTPQNFIGTTGFTYQYLLNNLSPNTTYYFRAVAQGTNGQLVYGGTQSFTTFTNNNCQYGNCNTTVFVTTNSATGVNDTFAILNGYVDPAGTNVTRWFEWGLGNGLGNTTVKLQQGFASTFSQSISGLQPNTTYYFRAVAQNQSGQQSFGNILTFTTTGFGSQAANIQAQTLLATNIGQTSARLNGLAIQNSNTGFNAQLSGYFEWGSTQSLGNASPSQTVGSAPSLAFYFSLFGLSSNSTYYYRAVVTDGTNIARGNIVSFTTGSQSTVVVTPRPPSTTVIVGGTSKPSLMALTVDRNGACNLRGSSVEYVITYKNVSSKTLKDVALRIVLPDEFNFVDASRGTYAGADRSVVLSLGSVIPGEEGTVRLRADVARGAVIGKTTVLTAYLVDTDPTTGAQEEVVAYALNGVCESGNNLGAASFFGGAGFLPTTLIGWLLLILLILALVVLARQMYGVNSTTRLP